MSEPPEERVGGLTRREIRYTPTHNDFDHLLAEAHDRGLRVLLDGVFNHVGTDFPRYRDAAAGGDTSWFRERGFSAPLISCSLEPRVWQLFICFRLWRSQE